MAAVVLAAGLGRRFGPHSKLLADLDGRPLVRRVVASALASQASPVVVVTGHANDAIRAAVSELPVVVLDNPDYASGMAGSLRAGIAALPPHATGTLVLLADMPLVAAATLDALVARFAGEPTPDAVVPRFEGQSGNPVLIGRSLFAAIDRLEGDEGARRLLAEPGRVVVFHPVDDPGVLLDVDTADALAALRRR